MCEKAIYEFAFRVCAKSVNVGTKSSSTATTIIVIIIIITEAHVINMKKCTRNGMENKNKIK